MATNYLLHNIGYDKPIDFRYIVLSTMKSYGVCIHLRDYSITQLDLYDVNTWLRKTNYCEQELKRHKELLKTCHSELKKIKDGDESQIKKEYERQVGNALSLQNCDNSWHIDEAKRIEKCTDEYYKYLSLWEMPTNDNFSKELKETLYSIYETAVEDKEAHLVANKKSVESMRNSIVPNYETVKEEVIKRLENDIQWHKKGIDEAKKSIEYILDCNKKIQEVFSWIEIVEKKVGGDNGRND